MPLICAVLFVLMAGTSIAAQGQTPEVVYVEFVTVEVDPRDIREWEAALADLVRAAVTVGPDALWLTYRGDPGHYRLVLQADSLAELPTFDTFAQIFSNTTSARAAWRRFLATGFTMDRATVTQQVPTWSTVEGMSTHTHPLAVVTEYTFDPSAMGATEELFRAWREFYRSIEYPYPVEGFRPALFTPGQAMIVVFPDTWTAYHGELDLKRLAADRGQIETLTRLRDRLYGAVRSSTVTYLTYAPELSYDP